MHHHQDFLLNFTFFSTRQKLMQGELPLNDSVGDPKFPSFLYDEDAMDGSFTTGLLRGPLLLAVSPAVFKQGNSTDQQ
jgi:hypothetical protein